MIGYTKVWKVNDELVVADNIEAAISLYKERYDYPSNIINSIEAVNLSGDIIKNNNAITYKNLQ